jgi:hypothetical protein
MEPSGSVFPHVERTWGQGTALLVFRADLWAERRCVRDDAFDANPKRQPNPQSLAALRIMYLARKDLLLSRER